jgi:hypothetical protein
MTLLEAIATGKDFRVKDTGMSFIDSNFQTITLTKDQLISGNWEVCSDYVTVPRQDYEALVEQVALSTISAVKLG